VRPRSIRAEYTGEGAERMQGWRRSAEARLASDEVPINMARLMAELNRALPAGGILIADGGFAAHWGGLLFDTKRPGRGFVPDRGLASIGYGVPGAIGARLGAPDRPIAALTGDGGLNMTLGELETAQRLGLGFAVIVVNNAASGYVKALQHLMYGAGAYQSSDLSETDYAATAFVTAAGLVRGVVVEYEYTLRGDRVAVSLRSDYRAVGETDVDRPGWVAEAVGDGRGGTATTSGGRRSTSTN
jgi:acetolactate synthase-1/2/3 large subunit